MDENSAHGLKTSDDENDQNRKLNLEDLIEHQLGCRREDKQDGVQTWQKRQTKTRQNETDAKANLLDGLEADKANKPVIAFYQ